MATQKKGYITVGDVNCNTITGWYTTLKEAQDELGENEEIYEVSAVWSSKPRYDLTKKDMNDVFGE